MKNSVFNVQMSDISGRMFRFSGIVRFASAADAAFRMIGRAIGARSVSGHGPSRIPGRRAGVSYRCPPPLLSIRALRRRRRSSLAMRRGATRTDGTRDDDEWFYEWTVRVGRESDESFPPAFPQRGVRRAFSSRRSLRSSGIPRRCRDTL